jgi:predicted MFS family arabinose efflux permease
VLRDRPEDVGLRAYGAPPDHESPPPLQAPARTALRTLAMASRRRDFWLLAVPFFICGLSTNGLIATHFVPAAHDHGISEVSAASLLAAVGAFDVVGTMASGWLTDRTDPRRLLFWYYALRGASLFLLPGALATQNAGLLAFAVFYGLDWVATVPPTVALARSIFGPQAGGLVFGWVFTAHQLGAAAAAWAAGASRVWWGDYQMAFMAAGALCGVAALLSRQVGVRTPARPVTDPIPIPEPLTAPPDAGLTPA